MIPFNKNVIQQNQQNNEKKIKLNTSEKQIIQLLLDNEIYTIEQMADVMGVSWRTVERNVSSLQRKRMAGGL